MANIAYPQQPLTNQHYSFGVHPNPMNAYGPVNPPMTQFYLPPYSPQQSTYNSTSSASSPSQTAHIAYVPVLVDQQGRPIQNVQLPQSFLPTVGLNQALMQSPWSDKPNSPIQSLGSYQISFPSQQDSSSTTSSDSGSTTESVSPVLAPLTRKMPPGLSLDNKKGSWYQTNEALLGMSPKESSNWYGATNNNREGAMETPLRKIEPIVSQPKTAKRQQRQKKKKFGYRSKQNKIDTVYSALVTKYSGLNTLVAQEAVLRGPDVIRLHVKKYDALCSIESALESVEQHMKITGVSIPLSMKNTFQKKGFLVYIQLERVDLVPQAQAILRLFPEFKKCGVANQTTPAPTAV